VKIIVGFEHARRGLYVLDARPDDADVKVLIAKGVQQAVAGADRSRNPSRRSRAARIPNVAPSADRRS
jgi:hypothetical protein